MRAALLTSNQFQVKLDVFEYWRQTSTFLLQLVHLYCKYSMDQEDTEHLKPGENKEPNKPKL